MSSFKKLTKKYIERDDKEVTTDVKDAVKSIQPKNKSVLPMEKHRFKGRHVSSR